ncbi:hypothetical protein DYU05_07470 [Mucilaginibacter terrenus]|uniref:Uncharacterized protein n=2 Tax=Mucilaginibacter terrenus TaxID=2482727 RepID=A0A3E2NWT5_9SPHI|nr:hypothetical protein DYU05_07470 [Mucilaginibacter terrenus]
MLAVRPCCSDNCMETAPLQKELAGKSLPKEKGCQGCSPFFSCGSCAGFVVNNAVFYTATIAREEPVEHSSAYRQPILKEVAQSIWQPPKIS